MTKTYQELMEVYSLIEFLFKKDDKLENTKFGYAWKKFYKKNMASIQTELSEKLQDINLEHALTDPKTKEILFNGEGQERIYKYDKEGKKKQIEETRKLVKEYEEKEIEIEPFITQDVPADLDEEQIELLKGLIVE